MIELTKEWDRQADRLAYLFATDLGLSRDQYMDGLPRFSSQPKSYRGRFDTPLLVQTSSDKLTLARMLEVAGIVNYLFTEVKGWQIDPAKFKTPEGPYATWLHDGLRNLDKSIKDVRAGLVSDERGGTIYDGVALVIQNPDILKDCFLDLPGSQYRSDDAPCLFLWDGHPGLNDRPVNYAHFEFGSVVAGRNVVTR